MSLRTAPPATTFATVRERDEGWAVYAVQAGVGATPDGDWGPATTRRLREYQTRRGLAPDGVAGPATQRAISQDAIAAAEGAVRLPAGLLLGLVENESGLMLGAVNHTVPGGTDCGITQRRCYEPYTLEALRAAFHPAASAHTAAAELAARAEAYRALRAARSRGGSAMLGRVDWERAAGAHNWPAAADQLARTGHLTTPDRAATWVPSSLGRMTYQQWCDFYVAQATRHVSWP